MGGKKIFGWQSWQEVSAILRCRVCNKRRPQIQAVYPREIGVPAGVPIIPFLRADDRERKRLVRIARG